MLTIGSEGALFLQGERVIIQNEDMTSFMMANIAGPCDISGSKVKDIMRLFAHLRPFIQEYFLEEYHVVDLLIKNHVDDGIEKLELYKEMVIDGSGYIHMTPRACIVPVDMGVQLSESPVVLVEKLMMNDFASALGGIELHSKFTLLEVLECFFIELGHTLTQGA